MKITASIYNLKQLNKLIKYVDACVLYTKEASLVYEDLDIDKAISLCISSNITPIIAINKMLYPADIAYIEQLIMKYKDKALFLATDIAVYNIANKLNCVDKIIYDPQTMITNYLDLIEYSNLGFNSISMSLEIPIKDLIESIEKTNSKVYYQVFGHRLMFYSKRKLISLYEQKADIKTSKNHLYLRESTRNDFLPVIENANGTTIYRSYLVSLLDNLDSLRLLEYGYLESLYLNDDLFVNVVKIFKSFNDGKISKNDAVIRLAELNLNIEDGFKYQDSIYQKELF